MRLTGVIFSSLSLLWELAQDNKNIRRPQFSTRYASTRLTAVLFILRFILLLYRVKKAAERLPDELPAVLSLVEGIAVRTNLYEQTARREVLIVVAVVKEDRAGQPRIVRLELLL